MSKHPDSPLAAEANFHVGESRYENAEYAEAAKAYAIAKQKSQPGELHEKATYKLGWSLFQDKKYPEALAEFAEQATDQPQGGHGGCRTPQHHPPPPVLTCPVSVAARLKPTPALDLPTSG